MTDVCDVFMKRTGAGVEAWCRTHHGPVSDCPQLAGEKQMTDEELIHAIQMAVLRGGVPDFLGDKHASTYYPALSKEEAEKVLAVIRPHIVRQAQEELLLEMMEPSANAWSRAEDVSMVFETMMRGDVSFDEIALRMDSMAGMPNGFHPRDYPTQRIADLVLGYKTMLRDFAAEKGINLDGGEG